MSNHIPPPHPVRKRPIVAIPLAVAAAGVIAVACQPSAAADATGPDCALTVDVTWDGGTVAWITATTDPGPDAPRIEFHVLGADNATAFFEVVTGQESATVYPSVDDATAVLVVEGWRPGELCQVWTYPPEPEPVEPEPAPVEPPAYEPPAPEPGDHRPETTAPATEPATPGSRVLHSL